MARPLLTHRAAGNALARLGRIRAAQPGDVPRYDRDEWGSWRDFDGDKKNARAEILIRSHRPHMDFPLLFTSTSHKTVLSGRWRCPFTGREYFLASDMDIDHVVPLKSAHVSGGWQWDRDKKRRFANGWRPTTKTRHPNGLWAVEDNENQRKGSRGPDEWLPPWDDRARQLFVVAWIGVKAAWKLTMTEAEWEACEGVLAL